MMNGRDCRRENDRRSFRLRRYGLRFIAVALPPLGGISFFSLGGSPGQAAVKQRLGCRYARDPRTPQTDRQRGEGGDETQRSRKSEGLVVTPQVGPDHARNERDQPGTHLMQDGDPAERDRRILLPK